MCACVDERLNQLSTKCQFSVNSLLSSRVINAHIPTVDGTRSNLNQSVSLMIINFLCEKSFVTNEESNKAMDKHTVCGGQTVVHKVGYRLIELCVELNGISQHILCALCVVCARVRVH